jgi:hypothetical protein
MKRFAITMLLGAALLAGLAAPALALTVFVEPIEVFNAPDVLASAPGLRSMVASRISGEGYDVSTADTPPEGTTHRVRTTITKIGAVVSVDASLEAVAGGGTGVRSYETVGTPEELPKAIDKLAERVRARLFQPGAQAPAYAAAPVAAAPLGIAAPGRAYAMPQPVAPAPQLFGRYKILGKVPGESTAFAVADIDGDGKMEFLLFIDGEIVALREQDAKVAEIWRREVSPKFRPRFLSAADIDGDRVAEIFVAGYSDAEVYTQPYVWANGELAPRGERIHAFLRPLVHPDLGTILTGIPSVGGTDVFKRKLNRYTWDGSKYVEGEELPTPPGVTPVNLDWVRFMPGGPLCEVAVDEDNRFRIYDADLKEAYKSEILVKGTHVRFEGELRNVRLEEPGNLWEIDPPTVAFPLSDGSFFAVMHDNIEESSYSPRRWGSYEQGQLMAFQWDGLAVHSLGMSPQFPGYFAGIAAPDAAKGGTKIYALLIKSEGIFLKDYTSNILVFDL